MPVYGKLSDVYGRKPLLMSGIVLFLVGSALSGLSQTILAGERGNVRGRQRHASILRNGIEHHWNGRFVRHSPEMPGK